MIGELFNYFIEKYLVYALCEKIKRELRATGNAVEYYIDKNKNKNLYILWFSIKTPSGGGILTYTKHIDVKKFDIPFMGKKDINKLVKKLTLPKHCENKQNDDVIFVLGERKNLWGEGGKNK